VRIPGDGEPIPVAVTPAQEVNARFSPGGKWIAYESDEVGGRSEIFVQAFPGSVSVRRRISIDGGTMPEWRRDGRELYFMSPDNRLMAAAVTISADDTDIEIGKPAPLFTSPLPDGSTYAPAPDGQRFLVSQPIEAARPIIILPNALGGKP
jgi:dipeptidyl aminopeptidase/acylaminoacyl peptidase